MDKITAQFQAELDELTAKETEIDNDIRTTSTQLTEVKAYLEANKNRLTQNITDDFNFGGGG